MPGLIPAETVLASCGSRARGVRCVVLVLAVVIPVGCDLSTPDDARHRSVTRLMMATGSEDGVLHAVGIALANAYNQRVPDIHMSVRPRLSVLSSAVALERGEVDLAFEGAGTGYRAYRHGTPDHPQPLQRLRTVAVLFPTVVHIVARLGTMDLTELRGKRIWVPAAGSPTEETARIVFESQGLEYRDFEPIFSPAVQVDDALSEGSVAAAFLVVPVGHASVRQSVGAHGASLVPIAADAIERIQLRSPFLSRASIPRGTYEGQTSDIQSVGTNLILICRDDLDDDLVYELTKTLFGAVQELKRAHPAAGSIDANQWATATIPLHAGAARFYRERELFR